MKTILCFGDSNTYGYDPKDGGRHAYPDRWPSVLAEQLGSDYQVIAEGLPGRTTLFDDPIHEGLSGLAMITPLLNSHGPIDLLIVMLGTNDTKERFNVSSGMIGKGLDRLLKKAMTTDAWSNNPEILVVTPTPITPCYREFDEVGGFGTVADTKSSELSSVYKTIANGLGLHYFDAKEVVTASGDDGIHLDAKSHHLLGKALAEYLKELKI